MSKPKLASGLFFICYLIVLFFYLPSYGINSINNFSLFNFIGDILFLLGLIGFFSLTFSIKSISSKIWKMTFWIYIIYLLYAGFFYSTTSLMIGNNGTAYSEIKEEGWLIFSLLVGIYVFGIGTLLFSLYKLGYKKASKN